MGTGLDTGMAATMTLGGQRRAAVPGEACKVAAKHGLPAGCRLGQAVRPAAQKSTGEQRIMEKRE